MTERKRTQWYAITEGEITGPFPTREAAASGKPERYRDGFYVPAVCSAGVLTADQKSRAAKPR